MSTLYIDRKGLSCRLENGALIFHENGERCATVPTAPLERIVFKSDVSINTGTLAKLGAKGIGMLFLSGHHIKPSFFTPTEHKDARRRLCQYLLSEDPEFCSQFTYGLLNEKLEAQTRLIKDLRPTCEDKTLLLHNAVERLEGLREKLSATSTVDALRGLEGVAASIYFEALGFCIPPSFGFTHRNRRPPKDPVNALLSLTYTLLNSEAVFAAHLAGLDPYVGFLHQLDYGRPSLACDLMEPLRPDADRFVLRLLDEGQISIEDFTLTSDHCLLTKEGRLKFYPLYETAAPTWRSYLSKRCLSYASDFVIEYRTRKIAFPF